MTIFDAVRLHTHAGHTLPTHSLHVFITSCSSDWRLRVPSWKLIHYLENTTGAFDSIIFGDCAIPCNVSLVQFAARPIVTSVARDREAGLENLHAIEIYLKLNLAFASEHLTCIDKVIHDWAQPEGKARRAYSRHNWRPASWLHSSFCSWAWQVGLFAWIEFEFGA